MNSSLKFPTRNLVSQQDSAMIQQARVPRSRFKNQWSRITAFDAGYLVPILVDEILPGDHMSYDVTAYVRMSTPLFPLFSNLRVDTFFFFIPNRLVWDNWARFMGEQDDPDSSIVYTIPTCSSPVGGYAVGSIFDHMGIPVAGQIDPTQVADHSALPLRGYNLVYNQWFRDQNIIDSLTVAKGNTDDSNYYALQRRAKSHDYFTSALPWPQKFTAPTVPLGGLAPVIGIGSWDNVPSLGPLNVWQTTGPATYAFSKNMYADGTIDPSQAVSIEWDTVNNRPGIFADLSQATGVAINTLRQAWMIQDLLERDARGGTRYVEKIWNHYGVRNPDFRLQRPEYIGGGQSPLTITPIAQTAPTEENPLGALGAAGTSAGSHRATYAATEHGYILGLINVKSELAYQQGLHKHWTRSTQYDFYVPSLAGLGEQAILRGEIYYRGIAGNDDIVLGYQERWQEYRTRYSEVTGIMRSTATGTIDQWHLAQRFATPPTLSQTFIEDNPPISRVVAAGEQATGQQFIADILYHRTAVRPIPMFGTPQPLGRF